MRKKVLLGIIAAVMSVAVCACGTESTTGKNDKAEQETTSKRTETSGNEEDLSDAENESASEGAFDSSENGEADSTAEVLNKVLDSYNEDEKFMIMGGDSANMVDGKAGMFNLEDREGLTSTVHISESLVEQVEGVASAVHGMNANTFTAASFKLKQLDAADAFAEGLRESILSTQWICGFPEKLVMYTVEDGAYVVYAIGASDLVDNFAEKLETAYGDSAKGVINQLVE